MVTIDWFEGPRAGLDGLFALADDSPQAVQRYRELGRVLVARDWSAVIGHLQLIEGEGRLEVKSLAVNEERQGLGVGTRLMERAIGVASEEGWPELVVSTAAADTRALHFYQRRGFRLLRVVRDVFTPEAGYPPVDIDGVALRDQVWLSLTLDSPAPARGRAREIQLRVARHTERLDEIARFYRDGLGLREIGGFRDHDGYDGVFLELPGSGSHLEFTAGGEHAGPVPHPESLLVLYMGDAAAVEAVVMRLGRDPVAPANPYWAEHGVTLEDPDGFHVVLVGERWRS